MLTPVRALKFLASRESYVLHIGCALMLGAFLFSSSTAAQDLFEIQVYPYETVPPHHTMVEFHMNYFPSGTKDTANGTVRKQSSVPLHCRDHSRSDKVLRACRLFGDGI